MHSWVVKSLGNVAEVYQPKTISQSELNDNGYLVYGANGIIGHYNNYNHETSQIAIACRGSSCGTVNFTEPKSWITGNAMVVNVDDFNEVHKKFMFYQLFCC
jgi:type I restriction enzyme S subunit